MKPTKAVKKLFGELYYLEGQDISSFRWAFKYNRFTRFMTFFAIGIVLFGIATIDLALNGWLLTAHGWVHVG